MTSFDATREAFQRARRRARIAAALEAELLHEAAAAARDEGLSVREASNALDVAKSTLARHWSRTHRCPEVPPSWGDADSWREAHADVWAHDSDRKAAEPVPYVWASDGKVIARSRGAAQLEHGAPANQAGDAGVFQMRGMPPAPRTGQAEAGDIRPFLRGGPRN